MSARLNLGLPDLLPAAVLGLLDSTRRWLPSGDLLRSLVSCCQQNRMSNLLERGDGRRETGDGRRETGEGRGERGVKRKSR